MTKAKIKYSRTGFTEQKRIMGRKSRSDVAPRTERELFIEELQHLRGLLPKNPHAISIVLSALEHAALADERRAEFIHRLEDFRQSLAERDRHHHRTLHPDLTEATDDGRGRACSRLRITWESSTEL